MTEKSLLNLMKAAGVLNAPAWLDQIGIPNWPFNHQMETIKAYPNHTRYGDFSEPGCVSADTEFLTLTGWKRIDAYQEGDKVAQYDPNTHKAEWVEPLAYIKKPCEEMYVVRPSRGLSMKLSADHKVLSFSQGGTHYRVDTMEAVANIHEHHTNGFRGLFKSTFEMDGAGLKLSDKDIRVMVMTMADGSFPSKQGTRCAVRVLKERKKVRCRELLTDAGIEFKEVDAPNGYSVFTYYAPRREKSFSGDWWLASSCQKQIILEEVEKWDGSTRKSGAFSYTSLIEQDIDFVQFVAVTSGRNATAKMRNRLCQGRPMREGTVSVSGKGLMHSIASSSTKTPIVKESTSDGFQYCFTVPSGFLVLRREGRVFTTGNCGKTMPAQVHAILMASLGNKAVFTMPPKLIRQFIAEFHEFFPGIDKHLVIDHLDRGAVHKSKLIARWDEEGWPDILLISYDTFRQLNDRTLRRIVPRNQWKLPPELWENPEVPENYWAKNAEGEQVPVYSDAQPHTKYGDVITPRKGKYKAKNRERMRLKNSGYNVYFFDEAHALCNPEARVWKGVEAMDMEMGDEVAMYLMTGTPIPTHLHNVYGLIRIINREAYFSKANFERKHCITEREPFKRYLGYKGEDAIHKALYKNARRVQKRDVTDLPEALVSVTPISLAGAHKKLYDQILLERFAILGDQVLAPDNDSALRMLALQLISCPDEYDTSGKVGKDNELTKWMDQVVDSVNPAERKLIIFAYFKSTVRFLANRYAKWNPAVMNGATTQGWAEVERFKSDDTCRIFVVNWGSGGAGLNLQVAHHSAFYEVPTSPKDAKQAMARTDRTGQKEACNFYFPRVIGTLMDKNFKNLLKNERSNNLVVRDKHDLLYDQLQVTKRKCA